MHVLSIALEKHHHYHKCHLGCRWSRCKTHRNKVTTSSNRDIKRALWNIYRLARKKISWSRHYLELQLKTKTYNDRHAQTHTWFSYKIETSTPIQTRTLSSIVCGAKTRRQNSTRWRPWLITSFTTGRCQTHSTSNWNNHTQWLFPRYHQTCVS